MNQAAEKIKEYMDGQIDELKKGMHNLKDRKEQPDSMGDLYNGMLRSGVDFEIKHMQKLKEDLIDLVK